MLVVEDDAAIARMVEVELIEAGYRVSWQQPAGMASRLSSASSPT